MEKRDSVAFLSWRLFLLLLLLTPPPAHQGLTLRHIDPIQSAQDPSAKYLSNGPGQEPVTVMTIDLTKISKPYSSFEFRTWDPEGVIFYGDTNTEDDWFVLGLRDGQLEIQLHNLWAQLTVDFGPRLNDGRWHLARGRCLRGEGTPLGRNRRSLQHGPLSQWHTIPVK